MQDDKGKGAPSTAVTAVHIPQSLTSSQPVIVPPVASYLSHLTRRGAKCRPVPRPDPEALSQREGKSSAARGGSALASHVTSGSTLLLSRHAARRRLETLRIVWRLMVPRSANELFLFFHYDWIINYSTENEAGKS